jgi:hypothetical protein
VYRRTSVRRLTVALRAAKRELDARVYFNRNCSLSIAVCLIFGLTWAYLYDDIIHSSRLQEEFRTAVRRLIGSIGLFAILVVIYLLGGTRQSANNAEPYAIAWGVCYVVSLLFLAAGLAVLIRDANRERRTGLYRFRR